MAWSTSQLAELAGTTLKTVRHYHKIGLLEEPERAHNGYKRYGAAHLVRLLRIRRLVDLGVSLSDIPAAEAPDDEVEQVLRALDAELAAGIERQQRLRRELAAILDERASLDLPAGLATSIKDLPANDRAFLVAFSSFLTPSAMTEFERQMAEPRSEVSAEFDALPPDAPDEVRQDIARRMVPEVRRQQAEYPVFDDVGSYSRHDEAVARSVVLHSLVEFYHEAHLDVLRRVNEMLVAEKQTAVETAGSGPAAGEPADGRDVSAPDG
ncbi:helix-turn-helix domain-containing protein [Streptomyces lonarensis]|uniref:MerR family transcriptional regulator n=1 Tax=Streptomyces lonarensis TaxID=700599 RepID=A0A7X6HXC7_9ACTN|nr:MerR family transcriptional regulator [Streptomyces lonarensis]NJQ04421.1 MerR family transcriptional regulator [Streptomyces lonarensis]